MIALSDPRFWLRCAALALLLAGLLMPAMTMNRRVYNLTAVMDITGSMNVRDEMLNGATASRLDMEKRALRRLLVTLPCGSKLGLAIFVEKQPFLLFKPVEICGNYSALDEEIGAIDWRMGWDSESHIAETLLASIGMVRALGSDLVFMTDGQETPPIWWDGAPQLAPVRGSVHGVIVGVGGTQFSPIPKFDFYGRQIGFFKPGDVPSERDGMFRGREHLSAVDEPHLRALGSQTGLDYVHLTGEGELMKAVAVSALPRREPEQMYIGWMFAGTGFVLLAAASVFGLAHQVLQRRSIRI
jgi:mxaL protein